MHVVVVLTSIVEWGHETVAIENLEMSAVLLEQKKRDLKKRAEHDQLEARIFKQRTDRPYMTPNLQTTPNKHTMPHLI